MSLGVQWRYLLKAILSRRENRIIIPVILIILILLIFSLSSIFTTTPSNPQLSAYSSTWRDVSDCRNDIEHSGYDVSSMVSSPTILSKFNPDNNKNMVYMSLGVERPYTSEESDALWVFLRNGGNIILADDFGYGNTFWDSQYNEGYGRAEFNKKQLFDKNYIKNTTFVTVSARMPWQDSQWYSLLLNAPTILEPSYGRTEFITLAESSEDSWLDKNNNRVRDPAETKDGYPLIMFFQLSKSSGKAIIISDPGLFINENWDKLNNSRYILDMINYLLPKGGEVIFDESRHITDNTFENTRRMVYSGTVYATSSVLSILVFVILIISFALWIGIRLKPQIQWNNENLLKSKYFNILNRPYLTSADHWQLYTTFLELVRQGYGFSEDEFSRLDKGTLYNLINNDQLWYFINQPHNIDMGRYYYWAILDLILTWKPNRPELINETNETIEVTEIAELDEQNTFETDYDEYPEEYPVKYPKTYTKKYPNNYPNSNPNKFPNNYHDEYVNQPRDNYSPDHGPPKPARRRWF